MPRENRVTPDGRIVADPARGLLTGNRGILIDAAGRRRWTHRHKAWISCALHYRDHRQPLASARSWTPLFFLDEAVALAAGHRPCALCRREDYLRFRAAWGAATGGAPPRADEMDRVLHASRVLPRSGGKVTFEAAPVTLPDHCFIRIGGGSGLILGDRLLPCGPAGYGAALPRPMAGPVTVLTPRPALSVLRAGYIPLLHPSAG